MKQSRTIFALLGWLSTESLNGYVLKKRTEQFIGEFWYGSFGQIYPLLHEMLDEGLVTVREEQVTEGRPPSKVYSITEAGRSLFQRWIAEPPEPDLFRSELLLKLFFGHLTEPSTLRKHLEEIERGAREKLTRFAEIKRLVEAAYAESPNLPYMLITLDRGFIVQKGYVEWVERSLQTLRKLEITNSSHKRLP